jgi:methionyl-tRNA formyltransferase
MGNSLKTYLLVSPKKWHDQLLEDLSARIPGNWIRIREKEEFNPESLSHIQPAKIFIPHWSFIIPADIYKHWECIVFHMTDLPFGKGGSPLQNLIARGHKETKISAIRVTKGIDTGDIYCKRPLSLEGTATTIFNRAVPIIQEMIEFIVTNNTLPIPQQGEGETFKRRTPEESNVRSLMELDQLYDYIRMLDCDGYPNAFLETEFFRLEFTNASYTNNKQKLIASVSIIKK